MQGIGLGACNHEQCAILRPHRRGQEFPRLYLGAEVPAGMACSALYVRAALFRDPQPVARADGSFLRLLLAKLSRIDVLVVDDWAMAPLSETERRDFWEICEDRYQTRSMILTSQLPVGSPGTSRSATPQSLTVSSTAWSTTPIALR